MAKIVLFIALIVAIIFLSPLIFCSKISTAISLAIILIFILFFLFIIYKILKIWGKKPEIGLLIGEESEAYENIKAGKDGKILFRGELWNAIAEEDVKKGEKLVITGKDGYRLIVRKK